MTSGHSENFRQQSLTDVAPHENCLLILDTTKKPNLVNMQISMQQLTETRCR